MEVYIEYVIIDNLVIDYLIIYFTQMLIGVKFKRLNIVLAVVWGVVCAVILPLFSIKTIYLFLVKIFIGFVMVLILKKYANFREIFITCIVVYTVTFLMGGICFAVSQLLGINTSGNEILINGYEIPMSMFVVFASMYFYFLVQLVKYLRNKNKVINYYYDVELKQGQKTYYLRGFLDSGNKLLDDNSPVVLIPFRVFARIFKDYPIEKIPLGNAPNNPHYITTFSVGDKNKLLVIDVDEIIIKNNKKKKKYCDVKLGISKVNFSSDFDVLLHSTF